jgi:hypothetical protein
VNTAQYYGTPQEQQMASEAAYLSAPGQFRTPGMVSQGLQLQNQLLNGIAQRQLTAAETQRTQIQAAKEGLISMPGLPFGYDSTGFFRPRGPNGEMVPGPLDPRIYKPTVQGLVDRANPQPQGPSMGGALPAPMNQVGQPTAPPAAPIVGGAGAVPPAVAGASPFANLPIPADPALQQQQQQQQRAPVGDPNGDPARTEPYLNPVGRGDIQSLPMPSYDDLFNVDSPWFETGGGKEFQKAYDSAVQAKERYRDIAIDMEALGQLADEAGKPGAHSRPWVDAMNDLSDRLGIKELRQPTAEVSDQEKLELLTRTLSRNSLLQGGGITTRGMSPNAMRLFNPVPSAATTPSVFRQRVAQMREAGQRAEDLANYFGRLNSVSYGAQNLSLNMAEQTFDKIFSPQSYLDRASVEAARYKPPGATDPDPTQKLSNKVFDAVANGRLPPEKVDNSFDMPVGTTRRILAARGVTLAPTTQWQGQ